MADLGRPLIGGRPSPNSYVVAVLRVERITETNGYDGGLTCADATCRNPITRTMRLVITGDAFGGTLLLCDAHLQE